MKKIVLSLLCVAMMLQAYDSDYARSNAAAKDAFSDLDCEFKDCSEPEPKIVEKVVYKEKVVYRDRPVPVVVEAPRVIVVETPQAIRIAAPVTSNVQSITDKGVKVDLLKCTSRGHLECEFTVTQIEDDGIFGINNHTRVYDDKGNENYINYVSIGNNSGGTYLSRKLIYDIPTKMLIRFPKIHRSSNSLSLLDISFHVNNQWSTMKFRKIRVER